MDESDIFGILQVYSNDESKAYNTCTLVIGDNYLKISNNKDNFLKTNESDPDAVFNIILSEKDDYNIEDLGKEIGVCKTSKDLKNRLKPHKVFELQEDKSFFVANLKFVFFSFESEIFVSWKKEEDERNFLLKKKELKRLENEEKIQREAEQKKLHEEEEKWIREVEEKTLREKEKEKEANENEGEKETIKKTQEKTQVKETISLVEVIENEMKRPQAFNEEQRKLWEAEEAKKNKTNEERKRKRDEKLKKEDEEKLRKKIKQEELDNKNKQNENKVILVPDHKKSLDFLKAKKLKGFYENEPSQNKAKDSKNSNQSNEQKKNEGESPNFDFLKENYSAQQTKSYENIFKTNFKKIDPQNLDTSNKTSVEKSELNLKQKNPKAKKDQNLSNINDKSVEKSSLNLKQTNPQGEKGQNLSNIISLDKSSSNLKQKNPKDEKDQDISRFIIDDITLEKNSKPPLKKNSKKKIDNDNNNEIPNISDNLKQDNQKLNDNLKEDLKESENKSPNKKQIITENQENSTIKENHQIVSNTNTSQMKDNVFLDEDEENLELRAVVGNSNAKVSPINEKKALKKNSINEKNKSKKDLLVEKKLAKPKEKTNFIKENQNKKKNQSPEKNNQKKSESPETNNQKESEEKKLSNKRKRTTNKANLDEPMIIIETNDKTNKSRVIKKSLSQYENNSSNNNGKKNSKKVVKLQRKLKLIRNVRNERTEVLNQKRIMYRVLCSGFTFSEDEIKQAKTLGIRFIEDKAMNFDLLIMRQYKRTIKFLLALTRGIPIVHASWLEDSLKKNNLINYENHLVADKESEKYYKYNLQSSLENRQKNGGFLKGYKIWISASIKPDFKDIKLLIKESDGELLHDIYKGKDKFCFNLMNELNEEAKYFIEQGYIIHSLELLYTGILKQELDPHNFLLK